MAMREDGVGVLIYLDPAWYSLEVNIIDEVKSISTNNHGGERKQKTKSSTITQRGTLRTTNCEPVHG